MLGHAIYTYLSTQRRHCSPASTPAQDVCWICLGGPEEGDLVAPCCCPRLLHAACLARWQLRRLSRQEGTHCRFCNMELPPWKDAAPAEPTGSAALVSIHIAGEVHQVRSHAGVQAAAPLHRTIRAASRTSPRSHSLPQPTPAVSPDAFRRFACRRARQVQPRSSSRWRPSQVLPSMTRWGAGRGVRVEKGSEGAGQHASHLRGPIPETNGCCGRMLRAAACWHSVQITRCSCCV